MFCSDVYILRRFEFYWQSIYQSTFCCCVNLPPFVIESLLVSIRKLNFLYWKALFVNIIFISCFAKCHIAEFLNYYINIIFLIISFTKKNYCYRRFRSQMMVKNYTAWQSLTDDYFNFQKLWNFMWSKLEALHLVQFVRFTLRLIRNCLVWALRSSETCLERSYYLFGDKTTLSRTRNLSC